MMKNYVILLGVLLLAACGKTDRAAHDADYNRTNIADGEIYKNVEEVLASEDVEQCDSDATAKMKELAIVLDSKVDAINEFMKTLPPSNNSKLIPFGESQLTVYTNKVPPVDEWKTDDESWDICYEDYQAIKNTPMSKHWVYLNSEVRSMITNDRKRLIQYQNLDLDHLAPEKVLALKDTIDACVNLESCVVPQYTADELTFIAQVEFYTYHKEKVEKTKNRTDLLRFQKRVKSDYAYIGFESQSTIRVVSDQKIHLHLPLNGSEFNIEQKKQLQDYMESVWKNDELELVVEWKDSLSDIFKIFFDIGSPGKRSYENDYTKEVHLFPFTSTRAVAHEIGHVIGFSDHYFPTWKRSSCLYRTDYNPGDIMSDSQGGVTADEWKILKKGYSQN